jgi:hypothetical protein
MIACLCTKCCEQRKVLTESISAYDISLLFSIISKHNTRTEIILNHKLFKHVFSLLCKWTELLSWDSLEINFRKMSVWSITKWKDENQRFSHNSHNEYNIKIWINMVPGRSTHPLSTRYTTMHLGKVNGIICIRNQDLQNGKAMAMKHFRQHLIHRQAVFANCIEITTIESEKCWL